MRAHIVIIGAGISGLTAAITIGEGVDQGYRGWRDQSRGPR